MNGETRQIGGIEIAYCRGCRARVAINVVGLKVTEAKAEVTRARATLARKFSAILLPSDSEEQSHGERTNHQLVNFV